MELKDNINEFYAIMMQGRFYDYIDTDTTYVDDPLQRIRTSEDVGYTSHFESVEDACKGIQRIECRLGIDLLDKDWVEIVRVKITTEYFELD